MGASCCNVMTSHHHAVGLNQNLSTVSGTWSYGKIALLVEAKIFSYKIIVVLCHNVNFDATIMTSWRNFFRSTLGWFCRQIISGKSHWRNFFNLLLFKSYKQKSKSWVIFSPHFHIYLLSAQKIWVQDLHNFHEKSAILDLFWSPSWFFNFTIKTRMGVMYQS